MCEEESNEGEEHMNNMSREKLQTKLKLILHIINYRINFKTEKISAPYNAWGPETGAIKTPSFHYLPFKISLHFLLSSTMFVHHVTGEHVSGA